MGLYDTTKSLASAWAEGTKRRLQARGRPNTRVDSGGTQGSYSFDGQEISRSELRDVKEMRESGGIVSHLVHAKSMMQFGTGADFEAENDEASNWLHEQFQDLDNLLIDLGEDATWFPYSLAEIVETQTGDFSHVELVEPWTTLPIENEVGEVIAWEQQIKGDFGADTQTFEPDEIASFVLNKSSGRDKTGVSEVLRAEDEITHFKENQKVMNDALQYLVPHHHWIIGSEGQTVIDDNELRRFRNRIDNLKGDTQIISGPGVKHEQIDLPKFDIKEITNNDLRQLCVALGVPIELASVISEGLGSGEQSSARQVFFDLEKEAKQRALGGQFVEQIARILLRDYSTFDHEQQLDLVFRNARTAEERKQVVDAIGDTLTNNEKRSLFEYAELDDESIGESFDSPGEESQEDPMGGIFNDAIDSALEERDLSSLRALQEGFDANLFELVATEEQEDFETGDRLGIGVEFPNSGVYVDWNIDAWPEEERLDGPHVSDYATIDDAKKVAQGDVRELSANELERGLGTGNEISLEEFESWMDTIHENMVCGEETSKALTQYSESQLPQMVKNRLRDAILGDAIFGQIDSIPSGKRMQLRNYMVEELNQDGWSIDGLANRLQDLEVGLSQSEAETIARTETQSAVNHAAESAYETMEEERGEQFKFKWVGSIGDRTTDACIWLLEQTNPNHGGSPVTLERLKELIQEAPEHDDDINTEPREFTPHIQCRKRYVRHVE